MNKKPIKYDLRQLIRADLDNYEIISKPHEKDMRLIKKSKLVEFLVNSFKH
jgi:hypothetical protein